MLPRPLRRAGLLLATAATVAGVAAVWPRADASGGTTPAAVALPTAPAAPPSTPAPTGLDPGLVAAVEVAITAARQAGHHLSVTSGFRTVAEQEALLAEAIVEHGPTEALRWVFPPDRSMHVRGLAVDVGDGPAATWLHDHGARFGLCRTLAWEWWHFEWRPQWEATSTCPRPARDPADAPS